MSTLSLCMIVKDEEANLERCLASVAGTVDEMVVVDTGSRDRTREIARSFGAQVIDWAWRDDFAAARNTSLDHAAGEWILFLDADEELFHEDREALRRLVADGRYDGYFLLETNFAGDRPGFDQVTNATLRLFRRRPEHRFEGAIHEQIMPSILAAGGQLAHTEVRLRHYGYLNDAISVQDKVERNLRIAKAEVARQPKSAFARFNLGMEYLRIGEFEKALEENRKAFLNLPDLTVQYASRLLRNIIVSLIALKRYDEVLKVLEDGEKGFPDFTDLFYQRGLLYLEQQDFPRAAEAFRVCLAKGESHSRYISDTGVGTYRAHFGLGYALEMMGDFRGAVIAYEQSLRECTVLPGPAHRLTGLLLRFMDPEAVSIKLARLVDLNDPTVLMALGVAYREHRHYEVALAFIDQALTISSQPVPLLSLKGEIQLHLGRYREASATLTELPGGAPAPPTMAAFAAMAHLLDGDGERGGAILPKLEQVADHGERARIWAIRGLFACKSQPPSPVERVPSGSDAVYADALWSLLGFLLERQEFEAFEAGLGLFRDLKLKDTEVHLGLGKLYYAQGYKDSAIEELGQVAPELLDAQGAETLGHLCEDRGFIEDSLAFYRAAIDREPDAPRRYLLLAGKALAAGQRPMSGEVAREGLRRFPDHDGLREAARAVEGSGGGMTHEVIGR